MTTVEEQIEERRRSQEALDALDRISRRTGFKFESEKQKATQRFMQGVTGTLTQGVDKVRDWRQSKKEETPETEVPSTPPAELTESDITLLEEALKTELPQAQIEPTPLDLDTPSGTASAVSDVE